MYECMYVWLCWVFVSVQGLSPVAASGGHSSSRCAGLSLSRPLLLRSTGSRRAGSVNCGSRAQLLRGMWDLPRPGLEPVSPVLAGRFLNHCVTMEAPVYYYNVILNQNFNMFFVEFNKIILKLCIRRVSPSWALSIPSVLAECTTRLTHFLILNSFCS